MVRTEDFHHLLTDVLPDGISNKQREYFALFVVTSPKQTEGLEILSS